MRTCEFGLPCMTRRHKDLDVPLIPVVTHVQEYGIFE